MVSLHSRGTTSKGFMGVIREQEIKRVNIVKMSRGKVFV